MDDEIKAENQLWERLSEAASQGHLIYVVPCQLRHHEGHHDHNDRSIGPMLLDEEPETNRRLAASVDHSEALTVGTPLLPLGPVFDARNGPDGKYFLLVHNPQWRIDFLIHGKVTHLNMGARHVWCHLSPDPPKREGL